MKPYMLTRNGIGRPTARARPTAVLVRLYRRARGEWRWALRAEPGARECFQGRRRQRHTLVYHPLVALPVLRLPAP